jgi:hypothetical protein
MEDVLDDIKVLRKIYDRAKYRDRKLGSHHPFLFVMSPLPTATPHMLLCQEWFLSFFSLSLLFLVCVCLKSTLNTNPCKLNTR